ncbi:MAG: SanA/YdcF family protein [Salinispira sp.]
MIGHITQHFPKILTVLIIVGMVFVFLCYHLVSSVSRERIFGDMDDLPNSRVGLLLGTAPRSRRGSTNTFFTNRIAAAAQLFRAGKIRYILASGDNSDLSYNEPIYMKEALVGRGIPAERIVLDYAGFSTLDSIIRARTVFGQHRFVIISQRFHNERAVYIAVGNDIDALAYNAGDVRGYAGLYALVRESLARVKAVFDIQIFNTQPKFSGPPETIP